MNWPDFLKRENNSDMDKLLDERTDRIKTCKVQIRCVPEETAELEVNVNGGVCKVICGYPKSDAGVVPEILRSRRVLRANGRRQMEDSRKCRIR